MIIWPTRGIWHRRDERGGHAPVAAGAHQVFACGLCGKTRFRSQAAVIAHERAAHQELIEQRLAEINAEAEAAPPLNPPPL
jgi:hypothetical protein